MTWRDARRTVNAMNMYPHLEFPENRRALEREREQRRQIREAMLEARARRKAARTPLLSRVRLPFRPSHAPCPEPS
jgi:hypothetical protein